MPYVPINVGAAPDDGTGDDLRTAFQKVNAGFAELACEVGTFTPTLGANTADPTVTYGQQQGVWARVGPLVFVFVRVDWTAISGGSGAVRIRGLDALPTPDMSFTQILLGRATGVDFGAGRSALYAAFPSAGVLQVASYGSAIGTETISMTHLTSNGSLIFQGVYVTA